MADFLRDCWYVAAWARDLGEAPLGVRVIDEPLALYRTREGIVCAVEDRCPHRWAPLSMGRVEGELLRCMYHGLCFDTGGKCVSAPAMTTPPDARVRTYPVEVKDSWLLVWMGDPAKADPALIPQAFGIDDPRWTMAADQIDYEANYMLLNDNLCDLSHVDFVHETTLASLSGIGWADSVPRVIQRERGIRIERWLTAKPMSPNNPTLVDNWSVYDYSAPGIFVMENSSFPHGMAERCGMKPPTEEPMTYRIEQQAVTPISDRKTRYFYASGFDHRIPASLLGGAFEVVNAAFAEDRAMIEAQQRIWDETSGDHAMSFVAHDKAPAMFRRTMARLMTAERAAATTVENVC